MTNRVSPLMTVVLAEDEAVAAAAWHQWRAATRLQAAPWQQIQLLPLIPRARFQALLSGDLESDRLNGIVRRAWTESQLHLAAVLEAATCILDAGCTAAVFGTAGIHLRSIQRGSIRPISDLRMLIKRAALNIAISALQSIGWRLHDAAPVAETLNWQTNIALARDAIFINLHWRAIDVPASLAEDCERNFFSALQPVPAREDSLRILSPGHELLVALTNCPTPQTADHLLRQFDAAILAPQITQWKRWATLVAKYQPSALESIVALRGAGIAIPELPSIHRPSVFLQRLSNAIRWRGRRLQRRLQKFLDLAGGGR